MSWLAHMVRYALVHWGYLALTTGLIGEDAGLPLPGETVLMFASFLSHKTRQLNIAYIIPIGIAAAICGDNLGFLAGRKFGPRLLKWLRAKFHMGEDIAVAEEQIGITAAQPSSGRDTFSGFEPSPVRWREH